MSSLLSLDELKRSMYPKIIKNSFVFDHVLNTSIQLTKKDYSYYKNGDIFDVFLSIIMNT